MDALPLPRGADEVTPAWLSAAVRQRVPDARITAAMLDATLQGTATKLRFTIERNAAAIAAGIPEALIVKGRFAPEIQILEGIYAAEVQFYRDLAPQVGMSVPRCFFAGSDPDRGQHIVVLEDLGCRDVTFCRVQHPLTYAQASAFLDNMARLHAAFWNSPAFDPGGALDGMYFWDAVSATPAGDHGRRQLEPEPWRHHIELPRGIGLPRRFRDRDWMAGALDALNRFGRRGDLTLLHGDHHLGNLYLDADGGAGVLDWQSPSHGSWSHDLTYFLVSALDIEDRRHWDRALVALYLDRLAAHGVAAPPTLDAAMAAFRIQIVDGLFYWSMNPVEWQAELNNCAVAPRFAIAALDHDTAGAVAAELARAT